MKTPKQKLVLLSAVTLFAALASYWVWPTHAITVNNTNTASSASTTDQHIDLSDTQVKLIQVGVVEERNFVPKQDAMGSIALRLQTNISICLTHRSN